LPLTTVKKIKSKNNLKEHNVPQVPASFSNYPVTVVLDGSGNGTITFQAQGSNLRITNLFAKVSTTTAQAVVTIYKGQIAPGNALDNSNSGSTGAKATGAIDLFDGETVFVQWVGGDPGATATATFSGRRLDFSQVADTTFAFDDDFAAGDGTIIYPALKSPNYVPNVSGWQITRAGNAEFNDVTVRGELLTTSPSGAYVDIFADSVSGRIVLQPPDSIPPGTTFGAAQIYTVSPGNQPEFIIDGPYLSPGGAFAELTMTALNGLVSQGSFTAELMTVGDANVLHTNSNVWLPSYRITVGPDRNEIGRGWIGGIGDTADSAAIGNALTAVLTTGNIVFHANRAYEVRLAGRLTPSAASMAPGMTLTSSVGTTLHTYGRLSTPTTGEYTMPNSQAVFMVGGSDLTRTISLNLISNTAGQTVTQKARRWLNIFDIGDASNFPDAAVLV
jgi:hypothetical protein